VFAEPTQESAIITVPPDAELRCFTRALKANFFVWRRVQVEGREAWVDDDVLVAK